MLEITEKSKCCGCSACQAVCPHDAIIMSRDALGFAYPSVAADKCVKCGLCIRVCDFNNKNEATAEACDTIKVSAARNRDDSVLENSQSGGVFTSLATDILNGNGTVYGAAMNADFTVSHHRIDSVSSLPSKVIWTICSGGCVKILSLAEKCFFQVLHARWPDLFRIFLKD